jgi:hypothetical protein
MKRRAVYVWAFLGGLVALSLVNRALNPHAEIDAHVERHAASAKAPKSEAIPAAKKEDPALEESRRQFRKYCKQAVREKLTFPASFKPHEFLAGDPWLVTRPSDHTSSWTWAFNFETSNVYGAVGRYSATCDQNPKGQVYAVITLAD